MPRPKPVRDIQVERHLAERVTFERQNRSWSYAELARRMTEAGCAIGHQAVSAIERNGRTISVDELAAMATAFEIPIPDLLDPVEVARNQRARELLAYAEETVQDLTEATTHLLDLFIELAFLEQDDPEIAEYVSNNLSALTDRDLSDEPDATPALRPLLEAIQTTTRTLRDAAKAAAALLEEHER